MSKIQDQPGSPVKGISGTRALKNLRQLQKAAPEHFPKTEPDGGFESVIPTELLKKIHKPEAQPEIRADKRLSKMLEGIRFPDIGNGSVDPLFNGTFYFVRVQFTIQNQGNTVISISPADMDVLVQYAILAAYPISVYAN